MCIYNILFLNADIEHSKQIIQSLSFPKDIRLSFADSGIQALSLINDKEMDLIIMHEKLSHKMNGIEVCGLLMQKSETASIPIVFLNDKQTQISECTNIIKYLHTDFTSDELHTLINTQYALAHKDNPLEIEKKLVLSIVNRIHSPIFIINHEQISFANKYFLDFFKIKDLDELSTFYPNVQDLFLHEREEEDFSLIDWLKELLTSGEDQEVIMKNTDEERLYLRLRGELLEHSDEYLIITQDISAEIEHAKELEELYSVDHLTKLPNRLKLISDLDEYDELALAILD